MRLGGSCKFFAFSLIEIVLALGVIAFALVAVIGLLPAGLRVSRESIEETRAAEIAQSIFETLRSQPFHAINFSSFNSSATAADLATASITPVQLHANYTGQFVASADYFQITLNFLNAPTGLAAGSANEVHLRITPRGSSNKVFDYVSIIGAH